MECWKFFKNKKTERCIRDFKSRVAHESLEWTLLFQKTTNRIYNVTVKTRGKNNITRDKIPLGVASKLDESA